MEIVKIEKRKLDWILKYADMGLEDANEHYRIIDDKMPTIKIGDILYKTNDTETFYNKRYLKGTVKEIVNIELGIIKIDFSGVIETMDVCYLYTENYLINDYNQREKCGIKVPKFDNWM